jgi:GNAT superfamily N-acetyltransferase
MMTSIIRATEQDHKIIADIGRLTFVESHGHSATAEVIHEYTSQKFSNDAILKELAGPENIFHIAYHNGQPAGYSKISLNTMHPGITEKNITKLERLYVLKSFYGSGIGKELFEFIVQLSRRHCQNGIWLNVWKENSRAINFYSKNKFVIVGSKDFKLTESHSNPNFFMFLKF